MLENPGNLVKYIKIRLNNNNNKNAPCGLAAWAPAGVHGKIFENT